MKLTVGDPVDWTVVRWPATIDLHRLGSLYTWWSVTDLSSSKRAREAYAIAQSFAANPNSVVLAPKVEVVVRA